MRIRRYTALVDVMTQQNEASTPYETISLELDVDLDSVSAVAETTEKGLTEIIVQGVCYVIKADHRKIKKDWAGAAD